MKKVRRGEIALALVRMQAREEGVRLLPRKVRGDLANLSRKADIPVEELREFGREITEELFRECFKDK